MSCHGCCDWNMSWKPCAYIWKPAAGNLFCRGGCDPIWAAAHGIYMYDVFFVRLDGCHSRLFARAWVFGDSDDYFPDRRLRFSCCMDFYGVPMEAVFRYPLYILPGVVGNYCGSAAFVLFHCHPAGQKKSRRMMGHCSLLANSLNFSGIQKALIVQG